MVKIINDFTHQFRVKSRISPLMRLLKVFKCYFLLFEFQWVFTLFTTGFTSSECFSHLICLFSACWCVFFQLIDRFEIFWVQKLTYFFVWILLIAFMFRLWFASSYFLVKQRGVVLPGIELINFRRQLFWCKVRLLLDKRW